MIILAIEASTPHGSVALFHNLELLHRCDASMGVSGEDTLFPAIQLVLQRSGRVPADITAIVCGDGPGSFTSLRIAGALAKGLAHATGATLYAVSSLVLAAATHRKSGEYLVHSDALRGERYTAVVSVDECGLASWSGDMVRTATKNIGELAGTRMVLAVHHDDLTKDVPVVIPDAAALWNVARWKDMGAVSLQDWEPQYGRLAEAQVKWEATHHMPLPER